MTYNFNNSVWNNLDLIFPEGGTVLEDVWYTNRQLRNMNLPFIVSREETHARDMVKSYEEIVWKNDGSMERIPFYNIYIEDLVDNIPLFNDFGQKTYNNYIQNKNGNSLLAFQDVHTDYQYL